MHLFPILFQHLKGAIPLSGTKKRNETFLSKYANSLENLWRVRDLLKGRPLRIPEKKMKIYPIKNPSKSYHE